MGKHAAHVETIAKQLFSIAIAVVLACGMMLPLDAFSVLSDAQFAYADEGSGGGEGDAGQGEGSGEDPGGGSESGDSGGSGESGSGEGGGSGEQGGGGGSEEPYVPDEPSQPETPDPKIMDIGIFLHGSDKALGYYSSPDDSVAARITAKGGTLELDSYIYWDDWASTDQNSYLVSWSVDDTSIATITQGGMLTARGDGSVHVEVAVPADKSATGSELKARIRVEVSGQESSQYVQAIRITDEVGNEVGSRTFILEDDLSTAKATFAANVDVYDASTGKMTTYSTRKGPLSEQVPGLADIKWYVGDSAIATIDEDQGWFRPKQYCIVQVFAYSTSGLEGNRVTSNITVQVKDPEGGRIQEGYHPQNSLKVKAYWSDYPPANLESDDERFVINKEYSLEELEGLGTVTYTYTALGGGNYFTMTGQGVLVATVLQYAGIKDLNAIRTLSFGTVDYYDRPMSASYLFGTNHYYYPRIQYGMYSEAVQVPPMLSFVSNEVKNADTEPNYDMTEATRFRLLVGATRDGGNTGYEIKWVHTVYVILDGAPPVEHGDGDGGTGDGGDGSGAGAAAGDGTGSIEGGTGAGGTQDDAPSGLGRVEGESASAQEAARAIEEAANEEPAEAGGTDGETMGTESPVEGDPGGPGQFSVYQAMNIHDVDEEAPYNPDNPLKPLAGGIGLGMLLAGGLESLLWYRAQNRAVMLVSGTVG